MEEKVSSQKLGGNRKALEGAKRPTAGDEGCEVRAQNLAPLLHPEGGRVPPFIEKLQEKYFPVIVVGGGHAGCEAALVAARMGIPTLLLTMNVSTIALMPCNPSIGGPGKGHLVREIGALGGEIAKGIDEACLQLKWLNTSRGPAVQARRAQADKLEYQDRMVRVLFSQENLTVRQGKVVKLLHDSGRIMGVRLETGLDFKCEKLILATGTYLASKIIVGRESWAGGPHNQRGCPELAESLREAGIPLRRLQTATPPRVHIETVNFAAMKELPGDEDCGGFSWENRVRKLPDQKPCYLTFTNEATIAAVNKHLKDSPLVLENITQDGPKHCPSIDRKVLKYPRITRHQIFVEPETRNGAELYLQGLTTSMPPQAQNEIVRTVPGLENAQILRYGYAIEYDALDCKVFRKTTASKILQGLYTAGQINGTSGYEEAATQGFVAGANAALSLKGQKEFRPSRTESYVGVLMDDLSQWERAEPYRITPFFAEFRLSLREESAEIRLSEYGSALGLIPAERFNEIKRWKGRIEQELLRIQEIPVRPSEIIRGVLEKHGSGSLKKTVSLLDILRRPQIKYCDLHGLTDGDFEPQLENPDEIRIVENEAKYGGYIEREQARKKNTRFLESVLLPLSDLPKNFQFLSEEIKSELIHGNFDDLHQMSKKHCLSRGDLAILFAELKNNYPVTEE